MPKIERVQNVLAGRRPDRPPVSFWHHFPPDQVHGPAALKAHMNHLEAFDLDFLKVMNDNGYPHEGHLHRASDLASILELNGDEPPFARQLDLLSGLRKATAGRVLMTTTIFNAFAVLRQLVRPPTVHRPPNLDNAQSDEPSRMIKAWYAEDPAMLETALLHIGRSLANFARRCLAAGADGIFLSVRDDWLDAGNGGPSLYEKLIRPTDHAILQAAAGARFNMLHVCGRAINFRAFAAYPAHVINWADRAAGPSIAQVKDWAKPALCGGVDNLKTLPEGSPDDVEKEVTNALQQAGARPILIAPGCTYDPDRVPRANLDAVVRAARAAGGN